MNEEKYDDSVVTEISSHLYDGGWRAADRADLMAEYGFTEYEAEQICEWLCFYENEK